MTLFNTIALAMLPIAAIALIWLSRRRKRLEARERAEWFARHGTGAQRVSVCLYVDNPDPLNGPRVRASVPVDRHQR